MTGTKTAILLLSLFPLAAAAQTQPAGPAHIILFRHAEKPADPANPHLSPAGVTRAARLVTYITKDSVITRLGTPVAIYATKTTKDDNGQRTQETVAPLAKALKQPVLTPVQGKDYADLAKLILGNAAYAGKTVLICWNHEQIVELARALGVSPKPAKWKASVFDVVYLISYSNGKATLATSRYPGR